MLDAGELAEMRTLQARAYGREAGLTGVDAARLLELQSRRVVGPRQLRMVEPSHAWEAQPSHAWEAAPSDTAPSDTAPSDTAPSDTDASIVERADDETTRSLLGRHWRPLALATVILLAVGVGLGWVLFGQTNRAAVALTPEQQDWQSALLADGDYDPGSVRAVAVKNDVVIWTATKDDRRRTCLILGDGETTRPNCDLAETVDESGIWGAITVESSDDIRREVNAQLIFTDSGEPAVMVSTWDQEPGSSSITYASEKETRIAERLAEDGFDANSIWVVGYDGDVPIWAAQRFESQEQCLIHDGSAPSPPTVCADPQTMTEQESGLVLNVVDASNGEVTRIEMSSNTGPSYLVITREEGEAGATGD